MLKHKILGLLGICLVVLLGACGGGSDNGAVFGRGSSRSEVRARLGEPEQVREFRLPEPPFFGPQEGLVDLVPAGTLVEEWVYTVADEELYVWFAGEEGQAKDQWRVIETARHPIGAVF